MNPTADLSPLSLFLAANIVVKMIMLLLILASVACWTVIVEKLVTLRRLRHETRALADLATSETIPSEAGDRGDLACAALRAGLSEWSDHQGARESDGEYRARIEGATRKAVMAGMGPGHAGLQLLATTGSVAPFVGLLGTVWGIMNSFSGIAASNDTSLAVVAPGIAEALFATAIGLVAAIPAVIGYNRLSASWGAVRGEALAAAADLSRRLSRLQPPAAKNATSAAGMRVRMAE